MDERKIEKIKIIEEFGNEVGPIYPVSRYWINIIITYIIYGSFRSVCLEQEYVFLNSTVR